MYKGEKVVFIVLVFLSIGLIFGTIWYDFATYNVIKGVRIEENSLKDIIKVKNLIVELEIDLRKMNPDYPCDSPVIVEFVDNIKKESFKYPLFSPGLFEKIKKKVEKKEKVGVILKDVAKFRSIYNREITKSLKNIDLSKKEILEKIKSTKRIKLLLTFSILGLILFIIYVYRVRFVKILNLIKELFFKITNKDINYEKDIEQVEENIIKKDKDFYGLFDLMIKNLKTVKKIIESLHLASIKLSSALTSIDNSMEQQSSVISEEASSINQVTASIEEYSITASEIAALAEDIKKIASSGREEAEKGKEAVKDLINFSKKFKENFYELAEKNLSIIKKSKEIDGILKIMEEITSEIHLLALNASIESAGAGEYGKRFGVIAQEIKDLADNSKKSIEKIKETIKDFHNSLNSSAIEIEKSSYLVDEVDKKIGDSEKHFDKLMATIEQVDMFSINVSNATSQQKIASEQIVVVMREISEVINISANEITRIKANLEKIMEVSLLISSILNTFKLSKKYNLIRQTMEDIIEITNGSEEEIDNRLKELLKLNSFIEGVFIADSEGILRHIAFSEEYEHDVEKYLLNDISEREWFKAAIEENSFTVSKPYTSLVSNELTITFTSPLQKDGEVIGVAAFDINYKKWIEEISHEL